MNLRQVHKFPGNKNYDARHEAKCLKMKPSERRNGAENCVAVEGNLRNHAYRLGIIDIELLLPLQIDGLCVFRAVSIETEEVRSSQGAI